MKRQTAKAADFKQAKTSPETCLAMSSGGWQLMPVMRFDMLSGERHAALADSQEKALDLIRASKLHEARAALAEGTWRDPDREMVGLIAWIKEHG